MSRVGRARKEGGSALAVNLVVRSIAVAGAVGLGFLLARRPGRTRLAGRVVMITGGSRGLGLALAREFGRAGCRLAICARDLVGLEAARRDLVERGHDVMARPCDVSIPDQVEHWVAEVEAAFGPIEVVVNNAGIIQVGPVDAMERDDFERAMSTNFWGAVHTTTAVLSRMRGRGGGMIVNITSIGGKVAVPHLVPYSCSKFALMAYSEGLAAELMGGPVRVVTVVPGLIRTGSSANALFKGDAANEYAWFSLAGATPLTAVGVERAARRIVRAVRRGETEVTLGMIPRVARTVQGISPVLTMRFLGLASRALPDVADGRPLTRGMWLATRLAPSRLTGMMNRAAREYNQFGGKPRPSREHARRAGLRTTAPAEESVEGR